MDQTAQRSWWGRNWKWVVPVVGCLSLIFLLAVLVVVVVIFLVFNSIKSHEVYQGALDAARSDPELTSAIGTPIDDGLLPSGSFEESGPSGSADFAIPVSGPNGSATVYAKAQKFGGQWEYTTLVAELDDSGRRINLLDKTNDLNRRQERVSGDPSYLSHLSTRHVARGSFAVLID